MSFGLDKKTTINPGSSGCPQYSHGLLSCHGLKKLLVQNNKWISSEMNGGNNERRLLIIIIIRDDHGLGYYCYISSLYFRTRIEFIKQFYISIE